MSQAGRWKGTASARGSLNSRTIILSVHNARVRDESALRRAPQLLQLARRDAGLSADLFFSLSQNVEAAQHFPIALAQVQQRCPSGNFAPPGPDPTALGRRHPFATGDLSALDKPL